MSLELRVVSEGLLNVTFGWTPVPGCIGYYFYKDGVRVSSTGDPLRSTVKFRKPSSPSVFSVQAMMPGLQGSITYPVPIPTPGLPADPLMPLRGHANG